MPGPCSACSRNGTFCHFHPRMDSRRKESMRLQDHSRERRHLMCGLLLALRYNPEAEIQELMRVIRSPELSAPQLATTLRNQLQVVSERTGVSTSQLSEDDILSLALADMLSHKLIPCQEPSRDFVEDKMSYHSPSFESVSASHIIPPTNSRAQEWVKHQNEHAWGQISVQEPLLPWDFGNTEHITKNPQQESAIVNLSMLDRCGTSSTWDRMAGDYAISLDNDTLQWMQR